MEYVQLNEALTEGIHVTTHGNIEWDANNFCSAEALTNDGKADLFRVVPLLVTEPPAFDPITQSVIRDGCEYVNEQWQYKWRIDALSPEQVAINQDLQRAELFASYDKALTLHLDSVAQSKRYDNRINCALRAGYAGPFQAEGIAFATWMDTANSIGYQLLADYQAGLIPQPSIAEMLAALPPMVWP